ncbi:MAG: hypothetical protein K2H60_06420 [Muribaculaceae bacterium]|nr:hypothetical protein [Muribaculaceae bacterium]
MKTTNKILGFASMAGVLLAMGACSTEPNFEPSMAGLPQASDYQIGISVDDLNNVELNILDKNGATAKGVYPIWYVNESQRPSTSLTYRDLITIAGDYPVEMKVGNGNGVSEGSVTGTIHIDKTIFDFTPYMKALTDNATKEWAVDGTKEGNMGCGPASNPTEWWNGGPGAKEAEGVYANTLIFGDTGAETTGTYVYDPGTSGTFYVNKDVHSLPGYVVNNPDDGNDFRVDAKVVESTFTLSPEGANLYLVLPANTPFPYIPSEAAFASPKYRITSFSKSEITLVQDLDGISWQYIIAPKAEADVTTGGFKYDYEHNLWKDAEVTVASTWFADGGWGELPNQPQVELTATKGIKFHTPAEMGNDQWQGQVHVETNIEVHSGVTYDFSCNVNVPKAGAVTVKVQKLGDDNTFFTADRVDVEPNGSIVWFADVEGFDGTLKIAFDFAGFGDCDIEVSNIVFKEHQYNDGTIIPTPSNAPVISDADNIFAGYEVVKYSTWFADGSWNSDAVQQPEIIFLEDGYSFVAPAGVGPDQWQGQVHVWTNVETSAENKYDFLMTIESDKDIANVTVKIQKGDGLGDDADTDDNTFIVVDRVNVEEGVPYQYYFTGKQGVDTKNLQVCMDYAGAPEKANITVSGIKMQVAK